MRGEDGVSSGGCDAGAGAAQASSVSKARRVVLAGAVLLALGALAAVAIIGGEAVKTGQVRMELSDRNEFEGAQSVWYCVCRLLLCVRAACSSLAACSTPSVRGLLYRARPVATRQSAAACSPALLLHRDANWDLKDIQQHLVRTQRQQTSNNKKFVSDIARIDMTIEDLMKQVPNTPSTPPRFTPRARVPSAANSIPLPLYHPTRPLYRALLPRRAACSCRLHLSLRMWCSCGDGRTEQ